MSSCNKKYVLKRSHDLRPLILIGFTAVVIFYGDIWQALSNNQLVKKGEKASEFMDVYSGALNSTDPELAPFYFQPIDVNRASADLLMTITGIGPVLAANIISYREQYGRITGVADLMKVQGIGEKRALRLYQELRFETK